MSLQYNAPKVAGRIFVQNGANQGVSIHSRPKAAGDGQKKKRPLFVFQHTAARRRLGHHRHRPVRRSQRFNTQPPEGGWLTQVLSADAGAGFQHTAARRRLAPPSKKPNPYRPFQHTAARRRLRRLHRVHPQLKFVSTHSRPKAAASCRAGRQRWYQVSTHSRPKAAAHASQTCPRRGVVSTHSRPKAAAPLSGLRVSVMSCFNTQPPEGGCEKFSKMFKKQKVSTHSRPKAAASATANRHSSPIVSTHSRPKAAATKIFCGVPDSRFQHTAARRRLHHDAVRGVAAQRFQHTAARRRLQPLSKALLHQVSQPQFR